MFLTAVLPVALCLILVSHSFGSEQHMLTNLTASHHYLDPHQGCAIM